MLRQSFVEAARGVNKELSVTVTDSCAKCRGTGADSGTEPERCPQCHGTGMETVTTGPFMMRSTCRYYYLSGRIQSFYRVRQNVGPQV